MIAMLASSAILISGSAFAYVAPSVLKKKLEQHDKVLAIPVLIALVVDSKDAESIQSLTSKTITFVDALHDFYWLAFLLVGAFSIATNLLSWTGVVLLSGSLSVGMEQVKVAYNRQNGNSQ